MKKMRESFGPIHINQQSERTKRPCMHTQPNSAQFSPTQHNPASPHTYVHVCVTMGLYQEKGGGHPCDVCSMCVLLYVKCMCVCVTCVCVCDVSMPICGTTTYSWSQSLCYIVLPTTWLFIM